MNKNKLLTDQEKDLDDSTVRQYDVTATPNDFNIRTIFDFIDEGLVKIPGFQRNYVWDIKRASKLIESIIIGLPIPQVFLYEEKRNSFLVIDGQQRLMSIYYFKKQRFPRSEKRPNLRKIFELNGKIPDEILHDDDYFSNFELQLASPLPQDENVFNKKKYSTLGEHKTTFDLRTIRNVVIRQNSPDDDDSSMYEIFNRLNSGGINLTPQEIRVSLYHSKFYTMLERINGAPRWRALLGQAEPDLHTKDLEILLRGFSMLQNFNTYKPSMTKFLNLSSRNFKSCDESFIAFCEDLFSRFLESCNKLDTKAFTGKQSGRINISTFEAVFGAACQQRFDDKTSEVREVSPDLLEKLREDSKFLEATQKNTASTENVKLRRERAIKVLFERDE